MTNVKLNVDLNKNKPNATFVPCHIAVFDFLSFTSGRVRIGYNLLTRNRCLDTDSSG